jgi:hypothetical protein
MNLNYPYLLDTNVFIQAQKFYYQFGFCPAFWNWIIDAHQAGLVCSIDKVGKELKRGKKDDPVRQWMENLPDSFFIAEMSNNKVRREYGSIMQWIANDTHYLPQAKAEFADSDEADAFLIATAMAYNCKIVTHEIRKPSQKSKVQLPDAADKFSVKTIFIYDLLSRHATNNFSFNL